MSNNATLPDTCCACDQVHPFRFLNKERGLLICKSCGLVTNVKKQKEEYDDQLLTHYAEIDPALAVAESRKGIYTGFLDQIEYRKREGGRLLDIGCGKGYFPVHAKDRGWHAEGVDIVPELIDQGRNEFGVDLHCGDFAHMNFEGDQFDIITMWNVFEEMDDPVAVIDNIKKILKPRGFLFIRTPNSLFHRFSFFVFKIAQSLSLESMLPKHSFIFHRFSYNSEAIKKLLRKQGFKNIRVRNSKPTEGDPYNVKRGVSLVKLLLFVIAEVVFVVSFGILCISSSLEVSADNEG